MPSAHGFIKTLGATSIQATSTIDQIPYNYEGTISLSVPQFMSTDAILTYNPASSLTGARMFYGKLGMTDVKLTISDGTTVSAAGRLTTSISPPIDVDGTTIWTAGDGQACLS